MADALDVVVAPLSGPVVTEALATGYVGTVRPGPKVVGGGLSVVVE